VSLVVRAVARPPKILTCPSIPLELLPNLVPLCCFLSWIVSLQIAFSCNLVIFPEMDISHK
jgi:hypothetical protein